MLSWWPPATPKHLEHSEGKKYEPGEEISGLKIYEALLDAENRNYKRHGIPKTTSGGNSDSVQVQSGSSPADRKIRVTLGNLPSSYNVGDKARNSSATLQTR